MAGRREARIFTSIWNDEAFLALSPREQRMYFFLLSQKDLSFCGVLSLRMRRWARSARDLTAAQVEEDLEGLAQPFRQGLAEASSEEPGRPLVVVDEDTEEVFVRSLIRHDGIWKIPNLLKSAREAATLVESPTILAELLYELRRIPVEESESKQVRAVLAEFIADLEAALGKGSGTPPPKGSGNPSGTPKPNPSRNPSQGKGEGNGSSYRDPRTPETPDPKNSSSPAPPARDTHSAADDVDDETGGDALPGMPSLPDPPKPPQPGSDDDPDWVKFWSGWPKKTGKANARKSWAKSVKKAAPFVIVAGAERYRELVTIERREQRFIKDPATWLNGEHWTDEIDLDQARSRAYGATGTTGHAAYTNPADQSVYDEDL